MAARKTNRRENFLDDTPDDVLENIFSFLSIKDAIKIRSLSTRFKNSRLFTRRISFDAVPARCYSRKDFISIVTKVLDLHVGLCIESFSLSFDPLDDSDTELFENWIKKAIDKGVKELYLDFSSAITRSNKPYHLSFDLLDIKFLTTLKLTSCYFNIGFMDTLFSNCLLIQSLELTNCSGEFKIFAEKLKSFRVLKIRDTKKASRVDAIIDVPSLCSFHYYGHVHTFEFGDGSQLKEALLNFRPSKSGKEYLEGVNFANFVSHVRVLSTSNTFLEGLSPRIMNDKFSELSYSFRNLKEYQLFMENTSSCNLTDILLFVKHCPFLEKLLIDLNKFSFAISYWEIQHQPFLKQYYSGKFPSLKLIKLSGFKFEEYEVRLVKTFLEKAIYLERLALVIAKPSRNKVIAADDLHKYNHQFTSWKASASAQIHVYEHFNDNSDIHPPHSKTLFHKV